ncbi:DNA/RNA helicase domain-containing protein [Nocardia salmonicida]|uniref:DNA/RNA helicase domain-containing protein n=1 Tax=Nocardia salmonicida TaxID=53431 RepID=UPI003CE9BDD0
MTEAAARVSASQIVEASAPRNLGRPREDGLLQQTISDLVRDDEARPISGSEIRFWEKCLPILANDLLECGLGEVEMLINYRLPMASSRVDVILCGVHPTTGADNYVLVELNQWTAARTFGGSTDIVVAEGDRAVLHPVQRVRGYCNYILDYLDIVFGRGEAVHGAAYLFDATAESVKDLFRLQSDDKGILFTKDQRTQFRNFLRGQLSGSREPTVADRFLDSTTIRRKGLIDLSASEVQAREQFVFLGNQRLAYDTVLDVVSAARIASEKEVVLITGGPGTGKSAISLALLGRLTRQGMTVRYATASQAITETMRRVPGKGLGRKIEIFSYFNKISQLEPNSIDVLLCDEAHRIRQSSANRFTRSELRTGRPQVDELIAAAKVPVFILDENQIVRPGEIGTAAMIHEHAARMGLRVRAISLDGQFRVGGSTLYESWVNNFLGLTPDGHPEIWRGDRSFEVRLADSPLDLEKILDLHREAGETTRISAGYCWPWSSPAVNGDLVDDVVIGNWAKPWPLKSDRSTGNVPTSTLWATDPRGVGQIGNVYTAQGFEYDWAGVIIGPDLVARDGRLVTKREANCDKSLQKGNVKEHEVGEWIRNVYKILLTRGMKGVVIFAVDPETQWFLRGLIEMRPSEMLRS